MSPRSLHSLLVLGLLSGCVGLPPEEDPVQIKLNELDGRLARVERVLNNQSLVQLGSQIQALQAESRELRGELEELQFELEAAGKRQRDLYLDVDQRLQRLESGSGATTRSNIIPPNADDAAAAAATPAAAREVYNAAFEMLKQGDYETAGAAFKQYLDTYPSTELAGNAQYWYAETFYVTRRFNEALSEFRDVVQLYPQSSKVPDALLKIGFCNYELRNWAAARTALNQVVNDFPDSTAANLAKQRLAQMQQESR